MIDTLIQWDIEAFRLINGWHNSFFDQFMFLISTKWFWIPFYALTLFFIYKKTNWKETGLVLLSVILLITLADQTASSILKPNIKRPRPCKVEANLNFEVHLVGDRCGGSFGFVSSHAANFFGLATFLSLFFRRKEFTGLAFFIAGLVAYSRIYLGVHYLGDVIGGGIVGIMAGLISWWIFDNLREKIINSTS